MAIPDFECEENISSIDNEEEFSIPIDISDILHICREYTKLSWQIQSQIDNIIEYGVETAINNGYVKKESLIQIKNFLVAIGKNAYFGDAVSQANECLHLIKEYEMRYKIDSISQLN